MSFKEMSYVAPPKYQHSSDELYSYWSAHLSQCMILPAWRHKGNRIQQDSAAGTPTRCSHQALVACFVFEAQGDAQSELLCL